MTRKAMRVVGIVVMILLQSVVSSALAQSPQGRTIEGVWGMSITLRDCTTGAPLGPPFRSLLTFHQGGTVSESAANLGFAPSQRTPGHGVWTSTSESMYTSRFVAAILFETAPNPPASPGFRTGWQVVSQTATLTNADYFTSVGRVQFYDINRQLYRIACPSGTGERFK